MGDLVLKGATSGQITITPTGVAGTNTLTLPAKTGNIITSADSGTVTGTMLAASTVTQNNLASNVTGNGPAFSVYQSSAQTFSNASYNKINFQTKEFDTGTCFNNTGSTATLNGLSVPAYSFMPNVAGYYMFLCAAIAPSASRNGELQIIFRKQTVAEKSTFDIAATTVIGLSGSAVIYCNGTTDYIDVALYTATGGTTASFDKKDTWFQGFLVRAA